MIWILMLAALAPHISCAREGRLIVLTKEYFCTRLGVHPSQCDLKFDSYVADNPKVQQCLPSCPLFSNDCDILFLDSETCTSDRYPELEELTGGPGWNSYRPPVNRLPLHTKVTKFTLELFKHALPEDNDLNYVLSPMMVQSLLAYLTDGASNGTRQAMDSVVQLNGKDLNKLKNILEPSAQEPDATKNKLDVASQIFRSSKVKLLPSFVQSLKDKKAPQDELDYSDKENAVKKINDWVNHKTRGKIPEVVDAESLSPETQLMLLNAIYFNGAWMYSFNRTEPGTFHVKEGEETSVTMMQLTRNLRSGYTRSLGEWKPKEGFMWVELPYDGDTMSMVLLLPKERFQLTRELKDFNEEDLEYILSEIDLNGQDEVKLKVPEFKIESTVSLVDPLKKMGLASAFEGEKPFDRISKEPVKISEVKQTSFLSVDQYGTIAASASKATIVALSLPRSSKFYVDQPFGAMIIDKANKLPLFLARVSKPEKVTK